MKILTIIIFAVFCLSFANAQTPPVDPSQKMEQPAEGTGAIVTHHHGDPMDMGIEKIGHDAFLKAPGLTNDQRQKLEEVLTRTMSEAGKIKMEIASQKVDFFSALVDGKNDNKKINQIKKKIVQLDTQRLNVMFKSLDEVQKIIGKNPEAAKYLHDLMMEHMPPTAEKL